jgi:alpha-galactosidase
MLSGEEELQLERSREYAADVIEAITLDRKKVIYGNVANTGLIGNLPDGCVEVVCLVDKNGVQPAHFGILPEQLAALNRAHMAVHELVVQALLERDRQSALYALLLDPLTAAVCSLEEIRHLFDEMWEAQRPFLTSFD